VTQWSRRRLRFNALCTELRKRQLLCDRCSGSWNPSPSQPTGSTVELSLQSIGVELRWGQGICGPAPGMQQFMSGIVILSVVGSDTDLEDSCRPCGSWWVIKFHNCLSSPHKQLCDFHSLAFSFCTFFLYFFIFLGSDRVKYLKWKAHIGLILRYRFCNGDYNLLRTAFLLSYIQKFTSCLSQTRFLSIIKTNGLIMYR
jgi:hypothetical protein